MKIVVLILAAASLGLGVISVEAKTRARIEVTVPAETDLSQVRNIAVMEFSGRGNAQVRTAIETALQNAMVDGSPYFTLVTRDQLERVLGEQNKGRSVRFDEQTAPSVGKLLGADALVTGSVTSFSSDDRHYYEEYVRYNLMGGKQSKSTFKAPCLEREARIALTANFIDVKTGRLIASRPLVKSLSSKGCAETRSQLNVTDKEIMLMAVSKRLAEDLVSMVTPHPVLKEVELRTSDDGGGGRKVSDVIKRGVKYAENGGWTMAADEWKKAVEMNPNSAAAHYNLGVAYESQGHLESARASYERAAKLKPESLYIKAYTLIGERMLQVDQVQRQTSGREP